MAIERVENAASYLDRLSSYGTRCGSKENGLLDVLLLHRVGDINPGEEIVLVGCWSSHRKAAFDGCRLIMEALKSKAPFWKKEKLLDGERWISRNTPG